MWCYTVAAKQTDYFYYRRHLGGSSYRYVAQTYPQHFRSTGFWSWTNRMGDSDWDDFDREGRYDYSAIYT